MMMLAVCMMATAQDKILQNALQLINIESGGQVLDINLQSKTQSPYS